MNAQEFCYWLKGFFELTETDKVQIDHLTKEKTQMIRDHLGLVFQKVTPPPGLKGVLDQLGKDPKFCCSEKIR